jgi:F-type H+-transporting ATPase subunit b
MKYVDKVILTCVGMFALVLALHLFGCSAFAAENSSSWRPTYDLVLRWINFAIIVFVVYKYAKKPFVSFLRGQKEKLAKEIEVLESEKESLAEEVDRTRETLNESEIRFKDLKERIVQQGERKKQDIIESAKNQSRVMLDDANRKIDSYILSSKNAFKAELIDAAIELAMDRLPKEITDEDNEQFIAKYLSSASTE